MLCTQMRLFERRFIPVPRESYYTEGVPSQPSNGYIQRPCIARNLEGNNTDGVLNNTPRYMERSIRTDKKNKPPLVVFSLKMQPGTKTLAQQDVKRDPRRLPFFCSQYKQIKREQKEYQQQQQNQQQQQQSNSNELLNSNRTSSINENDVNLLNNLFIKGVEILTETPTKDDDNKEYDENNIELNNDKIYYDNFIPKELQHIQLTDCCQCMRDVNFLKRELQFGHQQQQQIMNEHQIDGRFLTVDNGGVVDGSYRKLRTQPFVCSRVLKRAPSPTTRQVINVTMNTKKT